MLVVRELCKSFGGISAVSDVSFEVRKNVIHSVIGPNGAGKTTLFNLITGVDVPTSGSIEFKGQRVSGMSPRRLATLGMSRTFQNLQICMNMSAVENVMVGAHLGLNSSLLAATFRLPGFVRAERQCVAEAERLMDFVGVGKYVGSNASEMPYGALKRLEIARALAVKPQLLLLDEPAAGLNHTETAEVETLIKMIAESGVTVILVEHDMRLVMNISSHILVLNYGKKLSEGTPDEVRSNPEVIAAYLGAEMHT